MLVWKEIKKNLKKWIFALSPLRILLHSSGFATATPDRSAAGAYGRPLWFIGPDLAEGERVGD